MDGDGKDEIIYGSLTIDNDGTVLYSTQLGHGDAMHVSDWIPSNPGLEVMDVHEHDNVPYHVEIHDGNVFVNNIRQNQSYTCDGVTDGDVNLVVPDDSCFVLGDNREVSIDSRSDSLGCIPYEKIIGKVMFAKRVVLDEEVN